MVALNNLQELFLDQLKDIYNAENQLVKALPKMAKAATNAQLKTAFQTHLEETQEHVSRLEQIMKDMGQKPSGKTCHGMKGLLEEGEEAVKQRGESDVRDAELIAAAQRVEHYEIAAYGTVRAFARELGNTRAERLLQETLEEEAATDKKLSSLAESAINPRATSSKE